ncbi:MAG: sulfite exporter TauE/SafE family protein, partial [Oscillospiraceae bacterium]|nr:sulfite exporter TauE/SafE family protein [Oscillospiraceae bacterium]
QGINLTYFTPTAITALITHIKNKLIVWRAVLPAVLAGVPAAIGTSLLSTEISRSLSRRLFGAFLLAVGLFELFCKKPECKRARK